MQRNNLRNISRVEQEQKRQYGWYVRVMRDGITRQKFFSDYAHGGKGGALLRAIAYRDELIERHPKPEHGNLFNRLSTRNTSGHPGVSRTTQSKRGAVYEVWQAGWTLPDGRRVTRKFQFSPDGRSEREARRLAIKAREKGVEEIERMRRELKKRRRRTTKKQRQ
ncbi:MAG: hypothetical protein LC754_10695 [Acidobacteria bacterium]|nr:hypothetical protein [Acidobacteriota bacterium]